MQHLVTSELNFASSADGKVNVFTSQLSPLQIYAEIAMEGEHSDLCGFFSVFCPIYILGKIAHIY